MSTSVTDTSALTRRASSGRIVMLDLEPESQVPLYAQVYEGVRQRILDGRLHRGVPLPSTRALARDLRISRSTVILAYEQLRAEGYVEGRMGAATRVAPTLPDRALRAPAARMVERPAGAPAVVHGRISRRAEAIAASPRGSYTIIAKAPRAFRSGVPAVDVFPVDAWGRLMARRWRRTPARSLSYGEPFGYAPLRTAIAEYLGTARGVRCTPDQVLVVNGSQQALDLAARIIIDPGDAAWLEDPGYHGARGAFTAAGARIVPVPVDDEGLIVSAGRRLAPDARVAFVTPSRQLPLGVTLSLGRRLELIEWAVASGAWLIEDDYDSAFRYVGRPLAALQGLDSHGCVLYTGTFSKVTFPAVRLGYLVVPERLIDVFAAARTFSDYTSPYLEQAVMADFMTEGHFERHIRRMRAIYHERQLLLVQLARRELAGRLDLGGSDAGMTLVGWLPRDADDVSIARTALDLNVDVLPLSFFSSQPGSGRPGLLLGYAGVREREIREGVTRLARALDIAARRASVADERY